MNAKYSQCSTCGHRSTGWTYREARDRHLDHMASEHPEIKLGTVIGVSRPVSPATREAVTEEMVERAATRWWELDYGMEGIDFASLPEETTFYYRRRARAALLAAFAIRERSE